MLRSAGHTVDVALDGMSGEERDASTPKIFWLMRFSSSFHLASVFLS
jgi:hypothetical protein